MDSEKKKKSEKADDAIIRRKDAEGSVSEWSPGRSFSRADFPVHSVGQPGKSGKLGGAGGDGSRKAKPNHPMESPSTPQGPFVSGKNPANRPSRANGNVPGRSSGGRGLHAWNPAHVDGKGADVHRVITEKHSLGDVEEGGGSGRRASQSSAGGPSGGSAESAKTLFPPGMLREAVLKNRENALHLLRRWFWEKESPVRREGALAIPPRLRIYIVLNSLGDTLLQHMMDIMSPVERGHFQEILAERPAVSVEMINRVRNDFPALLKSGS